MEVDIYDTDRRYNIIYADPAWSYRDKCNSGKRGASHKYKLMTLEDMMQMPVAKLAADDCILFMWHVPPMPMEAIRLLLAWGFELKTMKGFTWVKLNCRALTPFMGMGNWTRSNAEDCLIAVKGKPKRINKGVRSLIEAPKREHSRKPDEARDRIVQLMGDLPRIELFARQATDGWDYFGDEIE